MDNWNFGEIDLRKSDQRDETLVVPLVVVGAWLFFEGAKLVFKYYEEKAEAEKQQLYHEIDLTNPPLERALDYFYKDGSNDAVGLSASIYENISLFKNTRPSYQLLENCLGWGIDDPYGYSGGDRFNTFFHYYSAGMTEIVAYVDGINRKNNGLFNDTEALFESYLREINQKRSITESLKGLIYSGSQVLGEVGLETMKRMDDDNYDNNGLSLDINFNDNVNKNQFQAGVNFHQYGTPVTDATVTWSIADTPLGLQGTLDHFSNGQYGANIDITDLYNSVISPTYYDFEVQSIYQGDTVKAKKVFTILPQNSTMIIVPDPGDLNAEEAAFETFMHDNYGVATISIDEFRFSIPNPDSTVAIAIFNNQPELHGYYSDPLFLQKLRDHLELGGNLALFGNAAELLDLSGITDDLFTAQNYSSVILYVQNTDHPITQEYNYLEQIPIGSNFKGSKFTEDLSIGMVRLGTYYNAVTSGRGPLWRSGIAFGNGEFCSGPGRSVIACNSYG